MHKAEHLYQYKFVKCTQSKFALLGPVVQSFVSLKSLLRVTLLTVLADSMHNILIFFAEKTQKLLTFFQQKISAYLRITRYKFEQIIN